MKIFLERWINNHCVSRETNINKKNIKLDTIFSSASNVQKSAIKIIRISGPSAKKVSKIFSFKPTKPRVASLRKIYDEDNNIIDNAIVIY